MAQEHPGFVRQGEKFLNRLIELAGIAAGKIAARSAEVRHEECIADEQGIADMKAHAGGRVARRPDGPGVEIANLEKLAILEKVIELRPISTEGRLGSEQLAKDALDLLHILANGDFPAELGFQPWCRREVIGMNMGFQNPVDGQTLCRDKVGDLLCGVGTGATGGGAIVQNRINDRGTPGCRVGSHMRHGVRGIVEKTGYVRAGHGVGPAKRRACKLAQEFVLAKDVPASAKRGIA